MDGATRPEVRLGRIVALVLGCLLLLPALGALLGGAALELAYAFGRDEEGFFEASLDRIDSDTVAVTTREVDFTAEPGDPGWVIDELDADIRLRATNASAEQPVFIGVGPQADVDRYLEGVAHDEVREVDGRRPEYRTRTGQSEITPPTDETFWVASASGPGEQELVWEAADGRWAAVLMNADGSPGVSADLNVAAKAGFVQPLALTLLALGVIGVILAVSLIVFGARGLGRTPAGEPGATQFEGAALADEVNTAAARGNPVRLEARIDPGLSRWQWLVKWILAIPHFVILFFLGIAFIVTTVVAGFSILFTGRYPQGIFDFNVGVVRWGWRVSYYATTGGIGTDRYPPFSLHPDPAYPATLDIRPPGELSRWKVVVKWWLLAIPHYLILGIVAGGSLWAASSDDAVAGASGGLLGVLVVITGVILLFSGRYPRGMFDLIIGLNRWIFRVVAYAALMTDEYPPFRLDQGGSEPAAPLAAPPPPPEPPADTDPV